MVLKAEGNCIRHWFVFKAFKKHKAQLFNIPVSSPDLNPIENVLYLVSKYLGRHAIQKNITYETFGQFSTRVKETMEEFSVETISNIIGNINKCMYWHGTEGWGLLHKVLICFEKFILLYLILCLKFYYSLNFLIIPLILSAGKG